MSAPVKLGFVMLAHAELGRVEQLARYFEIGRAHV